MLYLVVPTSILPPGRWASVPKGGTKPLTLSNFKYPFPVVFVKLKTKLLLLLLKSMFSWNCKSLIIVLPVPLDLSCIVPSFSSEEITLPSIENLWSELNPLLRLYSGSHTMVGWFYVRKK